MSIDLAFDWLAAATWKGSLLVLFTLAVHRLARNRIAPRWLFLLLLVALVRLLIPVAPESRFSIFNLAPRREAIVLASPPNIARAVAPPPVHMAEPLRVRPSRDIDPLRATVLAIWMGGVMLVVTRTVVRTVRLRRALAHRTRVTSDAHLQLFDECRGALGVRREVTLAVSDAVGMPSLHGWMRPTLLLPSDYAHAFTIAQLRFVMLHELAHLRRFDVLVNWIVAAAHALHWFNPLVRVAVSRLAEERELACDALALAALRSDERTAYGSFVLQLLDRLRMPSAVPGLVGMTVTKEQMKRRILMIATFQPQSRRSLAFGAVIALVALVTLTDASAGERRLRMKGPMSPAAHAAMESLETLMSIDLKEANLDAVTNAVSNATGVAVTFTDEARDLSRDAKFTLKGENIPAHVVLMESLMSIGLAIDFTDEGAKVIKAPEGRMRMRAPGPPAIGAEEGAIIMRGRGAPGPPPMERAIEIEAVDDGADDGVTRRKIRFRGGEEGQTEGVLEIEVRGGAASSARSH